MSAAADAGAVRRSWSDATMKVFLSWSGDVSRRVAEALREWLPNVIQAVEPWMSAEDIEKGARWSSDIAAELVKTKAGILCVTPTNQDAPWLNFEAGALSKTVDKTLVCPYLVGLRPPDLKGPLVQFQAAEATEVDTRKLIGTINRALGDQALPDKQLSKTFEIWWPELEKALNGVRATKAPEAVPRPEREILEEILAAVREQSKQTPSVFVLGSGFSQREPFRFWDSSVRKDTFSRLLRNYTVHDPNVIFVDPITHELLDHESGESTHSKEVKPTPPPEPKALDETPDSPKQGAEESSKKRKDGA